MPKYPKYSDRLNFFFVLHGYEIPMENHFSFIEKLQSRFSRPCKIDNALIGALTLSASLERELNVTIQPETQVGHVRDLRIVFNRFFARAEKVLSNPKASKIQKLEALLSLLSSTVKIINAYFQAMDNTWLLKYGSISSEYLLYRSPLEFLEILPITEKLLGKNYRRTVEKLEEEKVALRKVYGLISKSGIMSSSFSGIQKSKLSFSV